jgi:hypothetical protein
MNTHELDTPCGFCASRGQRDIAGGTWLSGPMCPDCGGVGYLVISADAARLLAFLDRHLGRVLQQEIAALRADLASTPMSGDSLHPHT